MGNKIKTITMACAMILSLTWGADSVAKMSDSIDTNDNDKARIKVISDDTALEVLNVPLNEQPLTINEFEVLVWNIYKGMKVNLYEDLFSLVQGKSLVLLQEGYQDAFSKKFLEATSNLQWLMASSFVDKKGSRTGVITGATQIASSFTFYRSPDSEPIYKSPKMSVVTYYDLPTLNGVQPKLLVINIHAINFVGAASFRRHIQQNIDEIAKHIGPVLFAGDFNTWNKGRSLFLEQAIKNVGLTKVKYQGKYQPKLDHVYQRGFENAEGYVHSNIMSSDHKPITVKLRLGNTQP